MDWLRTSTAMGAIRSYGNNYGVATNTLPTIPPSLVVGNFDRVGGADLAFGCLQGVTVLRNIGVDPQFVRGDNNGDQSIDLTDGIGLLDYLFGSSGGTPVCADAADFDDNGTLDLGDAVLLLGWLFIPGSLAPPAPFPSCGLSTDTSDLDLGCITPGC
ncbi:MAG: hypothetical protein KDC38_13145 [Planctomycetes bacterium]|nr:hypothetical protein [Planctomycetota bacterium]